MIKLKHHDHAFIFFFIFTFLMKQYSCAQLGTLSIKKGFTAFPWAGVFAEKDFSVVLSVITILTDQLRAGFEFPTLKNIKI